MTEHSDMTVVDFANAYIGGGSLTKGSAQEEILFLIYPQLYATIPFCAKMKYNEAIFLSNFRRYATYTGYGHTL
jgi:poly(ADP-ribose) glycohydrolase